MKDNLIRMTSNRKKPVYNFSDFCNKYKIQASLLNNSKNLRQAYCMTIQILLAKTKLLNATPVQIVEIMEKDCKDIKISNQFPEDINFQILKAALQTLDKDSDLNEAINTSSKTIASIDPLDLSKLSNDTNQIQNSIDYHSLYTLLINKDDIIPNIISILGISQACNDDYENVEKLRDICDEEGANVINNIKFDPTFLSALNTYFITLNSSSRLSNNNNNQLQNHNWELIRYNNELLKQIKEQDNTIQTLKANIDGINLSIATNINTDDEDYSSSPEQPNFMTCMQQSRINTLLSEKDKLVAKIAIIEDEKHKEITRIQQTLNSTEYKYNNAIKIIFAMTLVILLMIFGFCVKNINRNRKVESSNISPNPISMSTSN